MVVDRVPLATISALAGRGRQAETGPGNGLMKCALGTA